MDFKPLINYINRYVSLTEQEEELLCSKLKGRKYLKGQYMVQQGDVCIYSNFVVSGCTKTFYLDDQGQEHIVMFSTEDWWSSDLGSLISQSPSFYNIQCLENTEVIQFLYSDQTELCEIVPKMDRLFRKILEKALVAAQRRIVENFSLTAKERYLNFKSQYPTIEQRIPQYMIASYLGITKEFLSKIKSQIAHNP